MKDYGSFYQKLSAPFRASTVLKFLIVFYNQLMLVLMPVLYLGLLIYLFWRGQSVWLYLGLPAFFFCLLSFFRKSFNQARPYQDWPIEPLISKETQGNSMPSRHVFSAVLISMVLFTYVPWLGALSLLLSLLLGLVRIIAGIHYPKDILVGYLCGFLAGLVFYFFH